MHLIEFIDILTEHKLPFDIIPGKVYKAPYVNIQVAKWFTNHKDELIGVWVTNTEFDNCKILKAICLLHGIPYKVITTLNKVTTHRVYPQATAVKGVQGSKGQ